MEKLKYLNLEVNPENKKYKLFEKQNFKIYCNNYQIKEHELHNSNNPQQNLIVDLIINIGRQHEEVWYNIIRQIEEIQKVLNKQEKRITQNSESLEYVKQMMDEIFKNQKNGLNKQQFKEEIKDIINNKLTNVKKEIMDNDKITKQKLDNIEKIILN